MVHSRVPDSYFQGVIPNLFINFKFHFRPVQMPVNSTHCTFKEIAHLSFKHCAINQFMEKHFLSKQSNSICINAVLHSIAALTERHNSNPNYHSWSNHEDLFKSSWLDQE